jgi:hypothetical protein
MRVTKEQSEYYDSYLSELQENFKDKNMVIVLALDEEEKKVQAILCYIRKNDSGTLDIKPMAYLFDHDPFERYKPICSDEGIIYLGGTQEGFKHTSDMVFAPSKTDKRLLN